MLPKTALGRTGLQVTRLGYGSMGLRGPRTWGQRSVDDRTATQVLNSVLDSGINFIDTAPDYGVAEERIGNAISHRRGEFYLSTKCGCDPVQHDHHLEVRHTWTRETIRRNLETSLRRLRTDYLDVLFLHGGDTESHRREGLVELLEEFKLAGKIRFMGVSSKLPDLAAHISLGCFDVIQLPFSCLDPSHASQLLHAHQTGIGTVVRGGIAHGGPEAEIQRDNVNSAWETLGFGSLRGAMSPAEFILRYTLSLSSAHTTIVGTASLSHLEANVCAAAAGALPSDVVAAVSQLIGVTN